MAKYDWPKIFEDIKEDYVNGKPIRKILDGKNGRPTYYGFWDATKANPELDEAYQNLKKAKADGFDSKLDEILDLAMKGARGEQKVDSRTLRVGLEAIKTQRGHLDPKYRDREVKHTHEAGQSWRQVMTEARQRREGKVIEGEIVQK